MAQEKLRVILLDGSADAYRVILRQLVGKEYEFVIKMDEEDLVRPYLEQNSACIGMADVREHCYVGVDLIILGNYEGAGIERVQALPVECRRKIVVMWHQPTDELRRAYQALGCMYFVRRGDFKTLTMFLREIIENARLAQSV